GVWNRNGAKFAAPAPRLPIPRVELTTQRNGDRVTVRVRSLRNANRVAVIVRANAPVEALTVNGLATKPRDNRWFAVVVYGSDMTVELTAHGALDLIASDTTYAFPAEGAALIRARNASTAVPIDIGDVTVTRVRKKT
ncbi:MAG TPA: hypothetical protein VN181_03585, partial [Thermoanaerobaculia bacterium]|nr:hypothetical protein [Thermoanaerobaculia bacterium]